MSKRTVLAVLTGLLIDETLAILGLVASWVVQLLDFVVSELTCCNITGFRLALNVRVSNFSRVSTLIALVMVESAAGQLMHIRWLLTIRTDFCLKVFKIKPEELVSHEEL